MVQTFTGNTAIKAINQYNTELNILMKKENESSIYSWLNDEIATIPNYDIIKVNKACSVICNNIVALKTALRKFNLSEKGPKTGLTIDEMLVYLPVYNRRKNQLDYLRSHKPLNRRTVNGVSEFTKINYKIEEAECLYKEISDRIIDMQEDINFLNSTKTFSVEIEDLIILE